MISSMSMVRRVILWWICIANSLRSSSEKVSAGNARSCANPLMAFSGVRISCDMFCMNLSFISVACIAFVLALCILFVISIILEICFRLAICMRKAVMTSMKSIVSSMTITLIVKCASFRSIISCPFFISSACFLMASLLRFISLFRISTRCFLSFTAISIPMRFISCLRLSAANLYLSIAICCLLNTVLFRSMVFCSIACSIESLPNMESI